MRPETLRWQRAAAFVYDALARLQDNGEVEGFLIRDEDKRAASDAVDACIRAGIPRPSDDEMRAIVVWLRVKFGIVPRFTQRGRAAAVFSEVFSNAGRG